MQATTSTEEKTSLVRLTQLADDINSEYRNSNRLAVDAIKGGQAAVKAALRAGALLRKAKRIVGHGKWLKWLADNCPDITDQTARNWMRLSNSKGVLDLNSKNVSAAYRAIGILPEPEKERKGIGTAPVDIFAELFAKFDRGLGPVIDIAAEVDPTDMPHGQRQQLLERAKPMIDFVERVRAAEAV